MQLKKSRKEFVIVSGIIFITILLGEGIISNFLFSTQQDSINGAAPWIDSGIEEKPNYKQDVPLNLPSSASSEQLGFNDTYYGQGTQLNYTIQAEGNGNRTNIETIYSQLNPNNQTAMNIALPQNALAKNISLSLTDLEKYENERIIGNNSLEYSPNYVINYTTSVNISNSDVAALKITLNNTDAIPVTAVNIYYNGTLNGTLTFTEDFSTKEHTTIITDNITLNTTVEFIWWNGTSYKNETNIIIYAHSETITLYVPINPIREVLNPTFRMNLGNYQYIAFNFTMPETANFTSFALYNERFLYANLFQQYHIQISIHQTEYYGPKMASFSYPNDVLYNQPDMGWQEIYLNNYGGISLEAGEYYIIINATEIPIGNTYYFDLFGTTNKTTSKTYHSDSGIFFTQELETNILFEYTIQKRTPTTLDAENIKITTRILDESLEFNQTDDTITFLFQPPDNPTGTVLINFNASWSVRFNITYSMMINQTGVSNSSNFILRYPGTLVEWNNTLQVNRPTDIANHTWYDQYNYTIFFPSTWINCNGSATPDHFASSQEPQLDINNTVAALEWTIRANSFGQSMIINTTDGRQQFANTMNITTTGQFNSTTYNATLTYWNANFTTNGVIQTAHYMENSSSYRQIGMFNASQNTIFDSFTIPKEYNNSILTARVWWNNYTDVGIVFKNFSIINYAELISYNQTIFIEMNISSINQFEYRDIANISIEDATITTNWTEYNWSKNYASGLYYVEFFPYNFAAGQEFDVLVNFSHPNYVSQWVTLHCIVSNYINTTLELVSGETQIYLGQILNITYSWLRWDGTPVNITNVQYSLKLDNDEESLSNENYNIQFIQTHENINIQFLTFRYFNKNIVGQHSILLNVSKGNDKVNYQSQTYRFYFRIMPIPAKLSLNDTSGNLKENNIEFFEKNADGLRVSVFLTVNDTMGPSIDTNVLYGSGTVYGKIFDWTTNQTIDGIVNLTNSNYPNGYYSTVLPTESLIITHDYEIIIFANTSDFTYQELKYKLILLPQYETIIQYEGVQEAVESKFLELTGTVYFSNGSNQWLATGITLNVTVVFRGKSNITQSYLIQTDSNGRFSDKTIIVGDLDDFKDMIITISYLGNIETKSQSYSVQIEIKANWFMRFFLPILLISLSLAIAIPLFAKYGWPFIVSKFPTLKIVKKMQTNIFIKKILDIKEEIPIDPIDQIKELNVPKTQVQDDSVSPATNGENMNYDTIQVKTPDMYMDGEEIPKPMTVFGTKIQRPIDMVRIIRKPPLIKKEIHLIEAANLEHKGDYFNAVVNYINAYLACKQINEEKELKLIQKKIKVISMELSPKEQIKILRIRQRLQIT